MMTPRIFFIILIFFHILFSLSFAASPINSFVLAEAKVKNKSTSLYSKTVLNPSAKFLPDCCINGDILAVLAKDEPVKIIEIFPNISGPGCLPVKIITNQGLIGFTYLKNLEIQKFIGDRGEIIKIYLSLPDEFEADFQLLDNSVNRFCSFLRSFPKSIYLAECYLSIAKLTRYPLQTPIDSEKKLAYLNNCIFNLKNILSLTCSTITKNQINLCIAFIKDYMNELVKTNINYDYLEIILTKIKSLTKLFPMSFSDPTIEILDSTLFQPVDGPYIKIINENFSRNWTFWQWGLSSDCEPKKKPRSHCEDENGLGDQSFLKANDKYAVDINLSENRDKEMPVFAVSDGIAVPFFGIKFDFHNYPYSSTWTQEDMEENGGLLIEHRNSDGSNWYSFYLHLSCTNFKIGSFIKAHDLIGYIGNKCNYCKTRITEHLHFAIYRKEIYKFTKDYINFEIFYLKSRNFDKLSDNFSKAEITINDGKSFVKLKPNEKLIVPARAFYGSIEVDLNQNILSKNVSWNSINPEICEIDANGIVAAIKPGVCRVSVAFGGYTKDVEIEIE